MEVGRTGGATPTAVVVVVIEVEEAGQVVEPHSRSDWQHPPPRDEGQDRKPEEHIKEADVDVEAGKVVLNVEGGDEEELDVELEDEGKGIGATGVETSVVVLVDNGAEDVEGGGLTSTTLVELATQPPVAQTYPGIQQPPPKSVGQDM